MSSTSLHSDVVYYAKRAVGGLGQRSRLPLEEGAGLYKGLPTSRERAFGLEKPSHLQLAGLASRLKCLLHPIALRLQALPILLLAVLHTLLAILLHAGLSLLVARSCLLVLQGSQLCLQRLEYLGGGVSPFFELLLLLGLSFLRLEDLVLDVLLEIAKDADDASALFGAPTVRLAEGVWRRAAVVVLWPAPRPAHLCALLHQAQGELVALGELGHGGDGRLEKRHSVEVVLEGRLELFAGLRPLGESLGHRVLRRRDVSLGLRDVLFELRLFSLKTVNFSLKPVHVMAKVLDLGFDLVLRVLTVVAEGDVVQLLLPELS